MAQLAGLTKAEELAGVVMVGVAEQDVQGVPARQQTSLYLGHADVTLKACKQGFTESGDDMRQASAMMSCLNCPYAMINFNMPLILPAARS